MGEPPRVRARPPAAQKAAGGAAKAASVTRLPPKPAKPPTLQYAKPKDHPFVRWMRHRRDFLIEELVAYRRMGMAVLVGIIFLAMCVLLFALRMPRTTGRLFQIFGN